MINIVQTPCLNIILSELRVSHQIHGSWQQIYVALGKLLQLQVNSANLKEAIQYIY